jgi:hypothetical protein
MVYFRVITVYTSYSRCRENNIRGILLKSIAFILICGTGDGLNGGMTASTGCRPNKQASPWPSERWWPDSSK